MDGAPPSKRAHLDAQLMVLPAAAPAAASSFLEFPTLRLEGAHAGLVLSCAFSPSGHTLASSSRDRSIALWSIGPNCAHASSLRGHKGAVLRVAWLGAAGQLASASADGTAAVWDTEAGALVRTLRHGTRIVNDVCASQRGAPLLASASDDGGLRACQLAPAAFSVRARAHVPHPQKHSRPHPTRATPLQCCGMRAPATLPRRWCPRGGTRC